MEFSKQDQLYMKKALSLAKKGLGKVSPNPMVGAVLIKNGTIISTGFHQKYGENHAEREAILKAGSQAKGATLYVTLEPCNHFGKTPPCTDIIAEAGVSKVIYSIADPNPLVKKHNSQKILEEYKIEVFSGLLAQEATELNRIFIKNMLQNLPYVSLKMASTIDGKIADRHGISKWITNPASRKQVQELRYAHDAILVGAGTILADDPSLTTRKKVSGIPWTKIILDKELSTPPEAKIFNSQDRVIIVTADDFSQKEKLRCLDEKGVDFIFCELDTEGRFKLLSLLQELYKKRICSVFVEGGSKVASSFLEQDLVDEFYHFIAPCIINDKESLAMFASPQTTMLNDSKKFKLISTKKFEDDVLMIYRLSLPS